MSTRLFRRGLAAAAACSLALAGATAAQAAGTPGWRVVEVYGSSAEYPSLQGDTATGPSDAWVAGTTGTSLVIDQWNGTTWDSVPPPAGFTGLTNGGVNDGVIGDTSPTNVWTFPAVSGPKAITTYALNWNGSTWTKYRLGGSKVGVGDDAVFSPTDVWAFGQRENSCSSGLGFGPPWTEQFNGTTWQQVSMPGTALDVSAISANDMWAYGPNLNTACKNDQTYIAMRWDGTSWQSVKLPKLAPVNGHAWYPAGMVAVSDSDVWISELVEGNPGTGTGGANNVALLHWNGTTWTKVAENADIKFYPGLTPDGSGGFWLDGSNSVNSFIVHYSSAGKWSKQVAPTEPGYADDAGSFVLIPGTTSVWGLGSLQPTSGSGSSESAILKYGN
jgi:hypothetical protein